MSSPSSPLRYPGGKQILTESLSLLLQDNGFAGTTYVEPYAGGAGAALSLLFREDVGNLLLNDADPAIFAFWKSILEDAESVCQMLYTTPLTIENWKKQKAIYRDPSKYSRLELGFATFFLNRCNRSGVIANGGVIGGMNQTGKWLIDARFNRNDLVKRIERISLYKDRIRICNMDAIEFLTSELHPSPVDDYFVYLDPPYFEKGGQLYMNYYSPEDHARLAKFLKQGVKFEWVLTYDNAREIRSLYEGLPCYSFNLRYSAGTSRIGNELLIVADGVRVPKSWNNDTLSLAGV